MKEFANLAQIVTLRRPKNRPLLDLNMRRPGKEEQLVAALLEETQPTALQLTKRLYGNTSGASQAAMRRLRGRVQDKLLNHLFFLDHTDPRLLVSRRYELECLSLLHKVSILYAEGEYVLTERLLRRCLRLAEIGEFTAYAEQAAVRLRSLYSKQRQVARYRQANKRVLALRQTLEWEQEAEQISDDLRLDLIRTVATRRAALPKVPGYLNRLEELHRKARTYNTFLALYQLRLAHAELVGHYEEVIATTGMAAKLLRQGKLNARRFDLRFNHFMSVYAHLRSRQYEAGLRLAETYVHDFHPTSNNWFYFYEHYLLLALHAGYYGQALLLLQTSRRNPSYDKQRPAALERWELLGAYTEFVQPPGTVPPRRRHQLAVFAALTVPEYTRDKRGHNVAILVFQLLHYLRERVLEPVLSRLESLRKYQQRHLRDAATLRSRTFLRLLLLMPEANFNPQTMAARGQKLLQQLQQAPPVGEADAEIEIIPYEQLWALTLDMLRQGAPE